MELSSADHSVDIGCTNRHDSVDDGAWYHMAKIYPEPRLKNSSSNCHKYCTADRNNGQQC